MDDRLASFAIFAAVALGGCAGTQQVASQPPSQPITIDAAIEDWQGDLTPVEETDGLSVGVRNDDQFLYLTLVATNEAFIRQISMQGLTAWFDAEGEDEKRLGVEFPLGLASRRGGSQGRQQRDQPRDGQDRERTRRRGPRDAPALHTDELAFRYGPDAEGERRTVARLTGVQAAAALAQGTLTYELRVPLQSADGFAVGAAPGAEIGLGLETPEFERPDGEGRRPRRGGGGMGPPGGGPPGGMGGPPGDRPSPPEAFSHWIRVTLAGS